jgi:tetratricopeptide (TPR) repeat protein
MSQAFASWAQELRVSHAEKMGPISCNQEKRHSIFIHGEASFALLKHVAAYEYGMILRKRVFYYSHESPHRESVKKRLVKSAVAQFREMVARDKSCDPAWYWIANFTAEYEGFEEAVKICEEWKEATKSAAAYFELGALHQELHAYDLAMTNFQKAEELASPQLTLHAILDGPDIIWRAHYHRGLVFKAQQKFAAAAEAFSTAIEKTPDSDSEREFLHRWFADWADWGDTEDRCRVFHSMEGFAGLNRNAYSTYI